jgi:hypothetical protein
VGKRAIEGFGGIGDEIDSRSPKQRERIRYDPLGNTESAIGLFDNEKRQVGLYRSVGLEVSEPNDIAGGRGNYGHNSRRSEDFPRSISVVGIGGPALLATQSNHPIEIAFLVFSEVDRTPHALRLTGPPK